MFRKPPMPPMYLTVFNMYYNKYSKDITSYIVHSATFLPYCWEHAVYINCSECKNKNKKQFVYTTCFELLVFMYWTCNNLLTYCGLVAARINAADKDLPVVVI